MKFRAEILILLSLVAAIVWAEESWSWDGGVTKRSPKDLPLPPDSPEVEDDSEARTWVTGSETPPAPEVSEARFLNIRKKLCALGLGINCMLYPRPPPPFPYGAPPPPVFPLRVPRPSYGGQTSPPRGLRPVNTEAPIEASPPRGLRPVTMAPLNEASPPRGLRPDNTAPPRGLRPVNTALFDEVSSPDGHSLIHHVHTDTYVYQDRPGVGQQVPPTAPARFTTPTTAALPPVRTERPTVLRQECQCVPERFCPPESVVGRSLIDARDLPTRNLGSGILSKATGEEENDWDGGEGGRGSSDGGPWSRREEKRSRRRRDEPHNQERTFGGFGLGFRPNSCGAGLVCCIRPEYPPSRPRYTCGRGNTASIQGRIVTPYFERGEAEFAEYPWQVAILRSEYGEVVYQCGGVLIDDVHILTVAHCIRDLPANLILVRLGEWDVSSDTEFYEYLEMPVSSTYIHPNFYSGNLENDIALIRLQGYIDFNRNPHISPVCLPDGYIDFTGQRCDVTGWGKDAFGDRGNFQSILKKVIVPVVSQYRCEEALRNTRLGREFRLSEGNICAGGEAGKDACQGDGGSSLVCRSSGGTFMLAGLVSWGVGCGSPGVPGVYVNVAQYLPWIRTMTGQ